MKRGAKPQIDRALGEDCAIPRRDFLQGTLIGAASALTAPLLVAPLLGAAPGAGKAADPAAAIAASQDGAGYYPPLLTGMRGSHPGSFEAAHALRDGAEAPRGEDTGEHYDLVVVGAGLSGLAAAHFFRARTSPHARVLLLDNHDDFGGHAKRNEFTLAGRTELLNGGTLAIDSPRPYSAIAAGLLRELAIDVEALSRKVEHNGFYDHLGLRRGVFFDAETFGTDKLVVGLDALSFWEAAPARERTPLRELLRAAPLPQRARDDIARVMEEAKDYMPGVADAEKKQRLAGMSYRDYLREVVRVEEMALAYFQAFTHGEWAVGIEAVSALDCFGFGLPGFEGMKLSRHSIPAMGYTSAGYLETGGSPTLHFPDGNATLARLLVRRLIPAAAPGTNAEDIVTARFDYGQLDRPASPVRLRLNSMAVRVRNVAAGAGAGAGAAREVEVTYSRAGRTYTVHATGCVLACWNMMIPYLCPELPAHQRAALQQLVKAPLVYTSVALRSWEAFEALGVYRVYAPGSYHTTLRLNPRVDIGRYRSPVKPAEPILLSMERTPCKPGLTEYEQNKAGRAELLATSFATFERQIREQLARTLGPGGFEPARDIRAITVNRWPHGYAPEYNSLFDPVVPEAQRPHVIGRAPFGSITIANSDSGAAAYTDSAIDQASRAVDELLRT
ncbi:MAG: NAD(P)-binding protein [Gammaproteobacteria bacterium]|nr:NAD(P)-binding protein [Gammaproteobacteria bacterium]